MLVFLRIASISKGAIMSELRNFIGQHGAIFYRNGDFESKEIRSCFKRITSRDKIRVGDLVWVGHLDFSGDLGKAGFVLSPTCISEFPSGPGVYAYEVDDEDTLLALIIRDRRSFSRGKLSS